MGKAAATAAAAVAAPPPPEPAKKRKKKGRPSLVDLQKRALQQQQRRSTRRNPNSDDISTPPEFVEDDDDDDDDDERKEKKVKLVVRLPQSNQHLPRSSSANSGSCGSDSNDNHEEATAALKKPKINGGSGDQEEKVSKATDTLHGSPLESGPTTPLPDKKLLVFILDRLQKKDTYGVFSEPVDPNELPDYHEIIETPMDFGTLRNKLDDGLYTNLEELEADVFLICANAMQYNSSDTIYFRQAKSIQELAKRDFENLRQEGDNGELQPKVVRRGRPPGKQSKKPLGRPPLDRVASEFTSGATLASAGDNNTPESNPYNLRRAPPMYRFNSGDGLLSSQRSRENYSEWLTDWHDEFPASILRADMKYGKKNFFIDETRRDTYKQFHPSNYAQDPSPLSGLGGDMKHLMAVGLNVEHGYARSLARFAANLGPVAWKVASKKIERILPNGVKFGPGWVGESESLPPRLTFHSDSQRFLHRPATSDGQQRRPENPSTSTNSSLPPKEELDEFADRTMNSSPQSQLPVPRDGVSGIRPTGPTFQTPQHNKSQLLHPGRNGFNGMFGYDNQMLLVGGGPSTGKAVFVDGVTNSQMSASEPARLAQSSRTLLQSGNILESDTTKEPGKHSGKQSTQVWSTNQHHRQYSVRIQPDLNVGPPQGPGSPGSGMRISSPPQQPDLALQL